MIKIKNNRKLIRFSDGFLPAALAVAAAMGSYTNALLLFIFAFAVKLFSLFSSDGVRVAFARQPSIKNVRGSVKCALLLQCFGLAVALVIQTLFIRRETDAFVPLICAGFLLNIEHAFYEYLFAVGDKRSAMMCQGLTALLILTGLLLAGDETSMLWIPTMTGISAVVAFVIAAVMGDGLKGKINAQVIRCAPRAAIQSAFYPLAAFAVLSLINPIRFEIAFFAGLTLYELCGTPFRRSPLEAKPLNIALMAVTVAAAAAWIALVPVLKIYFPDDEIPVACAMLVTAAICAFAVYGNIKINN